MSSLFGSLFGSSPSVSSYPIYLQSSLNQGQTAAGNALSGGLTGSGNLGALVQSLYPSYTGQVAAPVSDATTQAASALQSLVPGLTTAQGQASNVQAQGQSTLSDLMTRTAQSYQPYYNANVIAPLISSFGGSAAGDILSATGGTGTSQTGALAGGGAGASTAAGSALSNFGTTLGQTQGNLTYNTTEQNQKNIVSALQNLQSVVGAPISSLSTALAGGVSGQQAQQAYLTNLYNEYTQGNKSTQQFITDLLGYMGVTTQTAANTNVAQAGSSGLLGSLLQGVGGSALGSYLGTLFGSGGGAAAGAGAGAAAGGAAAAGAADAAVGGAAAAGGTAAGASAAADLLPLIALA